MISILVYIVYDYKTEGKKERKKKRKKERMKYNSLSQG